MARRYVVISEIPNNDIYTAVAVCDTLETACGEMLLEVADFMKNNLEKDGNVRQYYLGSLEEMEGENGFMLCGYFCDEPEMYAIRGMALELNEEAGNA